MGGVLVHLLNSFPANTPIFYQLKTSKKKNIRVRFSEVLGGRKLKYWLKIGSCTIILFEIFCSMVISAYYFRKTGAFATKWGMIFA